MILPAILEVLHQEYPACQWCIFSIACEAALGMGQHLSDFTEYSRNCYYVILVRRELFDPGSLLEE